ncbi:MAG: hypothetical protein V4523_07985 [Pseudomonadota bacterium]
MVDDTEYRFRIGAFSPATIPMGRLAEYMGALADMIGHKERTHFVTLDEGSTDIVHRVESVDAPKVEQRLLAISYGNADKAAMKAFDRLNDLLANDNAIGALAGPVNILFAGRDKTKPVVYPPIRQSGSIIGQVVNIGGKDSTAHVILENEGVIYSNCELTRSMARDLAQHLYGPTIRLNGSGKWQRLEDGQWKLHAFKVDSFDVLDDAPLDEVLRRIATIEGNGLMSNDVYAAMIELRDGQERQH